MENDNFLDPLKRIALVDPPPFLFTRIDARLSALVAEKPKWSWVLAGTTALLLVVAMNVSVFVGQVSSNATADGSVATMAKGMGMYGYNQLYNE